MPCAAYDLYAGYYYQPYNLTYGYGYDETAGFPAGTDEYNHAGNPHHHHFPDGSTVTHSHPLTPAEAPSNSDIYYGPVPAPGQEGYYDDITPDEDGTFGFPAPAPAPSPSIIGDVLYGSSYNYQPYEYERYDVMPDAQILYFDSDFVVRPGLYKSAEAAAPSSVTGHRSPL
jgi:hypothetical protein